MKAVLLISLGLGFLYHPLFLGLALAAAILLTVGFINPRFFLYISLTFGAIEIIAFTYHQGIEMTQIGYKIMTTLAPFFLLIALICWMAARLARLEPPVPQTNTLDLPVFVMLFSSAISLIWTPYLFDGTKIVLYSAESVLWFFLLTRLIQTSRQVQFYFRFFLFLAFVITVSIIVTFFTSFKIGSPWHLEIIQGHYISWKPITIPQYVGRRGQLIGLIGGAKSLAPFLNIAIPFAVALMCIQTRVFWRRFLQVWVVVMLALHILSLSRIDMAGLGLGWLAFVYLNPKWRPKFFRYQAYMGLSMVIAYILVVTLMVNFWSIGMESGWQEFLQRYGFGTAKYSSRGGPAAEIRTHRFMLAVENVMKTGGWGEGVGGIMRGIDSTYHIDTGGSFNAIYLEHGYGILSYLIFIWIFMNMALEMRRAHRKWQGDPYGFYLRGLIWALIATVTAACLDYVYYSFKYFTLMGISIAAAHAIHPQGSSSGNVAEAP